MNVDKFGHHTYKSRKINENSIIRTVCLLKCINGQLDAQNKTIKNIGNPVDDNDSVTKAYVDNGLGREIKTLKEIQRELSIRLNKLEALIESHTATNHEQSKRGKRNT